MKKSIISPGAEIKQLNFPQFFILLLVAHNDRDFLSYTKDNASQTQGIIVISAGSNVPKHINLICKKQLRKLKHALAKHSLLLITNTKITRT